MMIDHKVRLDWPSDTPDWLKSLVSSLDRRHGPVTVLPLIAIVDEIDQWVEFASGEDAWKSKDNRSSLELDLHEAVAVGDTRLRQVLKSELEAFHGAFSALITSPRGVLDEPPGLRTSKIWSTVRTTADDLRTALTSDAAVGACWDDLVTIAQDRRLVGREYRGIADLLFAQIDARGDDAGDLLDHVARVVAYESGPFALNPEEPLSLTGRVAKAREIVTTRPTVEAVVVWLGYQGHQFEHAQAGNITFLNAHWCVPNARPDRQDFPYKEELWHLVEDGFLFQVAERVDEPSNADSLVRVDLGSTTITGSAERAIALVEMIIDVTAHSSGGTRPHLAEQAVLGDGRLRTSSLVARTRGTGFPDDHYGAGITVKALGKYGPELAEALALEEMPRFLAAALEAQIAAYKPFSREMAMSTPSPADIRGVIPLADQVVQRIAAHAATKPKDLNILLGAQWPHARWLSELRRAVHMCLLGGAEHRETIDAMRGEWFHSDPEHPWMLFISDRSRDMLSTCQVESERAWVERMFQSVEDVGVYHLLIAGYEREGVMLDKRRKRVRNGLVHGNPVADAAVESVRDFAEFLSHTALYQCLDAYLSGDNPGTVLARRSEELQALQAGQDAATFWRRQVGAAPQAAGAILADDGILRT